MWGNVRTVDRPPLIIGHPLICPLSRATGASPTRAAMRSLSKCPCSGSSVINVAATISPTPGTVFDRLAVSANSISTAISFAMCFSHLRIRQWLRR